MINSATNASLAWAGPRGGASRWAGRAPTLAVTLGVVLAACGPTPQPIATFSQCNPVTPAELPSGASIGPATIATVDGIVHTTWGTGRDSVTVFSAFLRGSPDPSFRPSPPAYTVRGRPATIYNIGFDGPDPVVGFSWVDGSCVWTVHLGPGNTRDAAVDYAARF